MHIEDPDLMCAGLWFQCTPGTKKTNGSRIGVATCGESEFPAIAPIKDQQPEWQLAKIAQIPLVEIDIVVGESPKNNPTEVNDKIKKMVEFLAEISQLPIYLTNA